MNIATLHCIASTSHVFLRLNRNQSNCNSKFINLYLNSNKKPIEKEKIVLDFFILDFFSYHFAMKHEKYDIKFFRYTGSGREGINARPIFIPLHKGLMTLQA